MKTIRIHSYKSTQISSKTKIVFFFFWFVCLKFITLIIVVVVGCGALDADANFLALEWGAMLFKKKKNKQ